ncbi:MAG: hypothetical protein A3D74_04195 [Candidatus Levybacteria bacterium RIFCSPHIGHO2_02_FULL_37_13]|nr:MAG: hypothetical protein A3D74_04195 [Candidatus Levybacteria bacterium RIFCSPHIGHO2_02_FULL_37_13]
MKNNKLAITIGIPAYNEEKNIELIINDILSQNDINYKLIKTIVVSDKSTDNTNNIVKKYQNKNIDLIVNKFRIGKSGSVKKLIELSKKNFPDVIVILDADLRLKNTTVIKKLIEPFLGDERLMVTSGNLVPDSPKTFVEKISSFNIQLTNDILKNSLRNVDYYLSSDQIMAFKADYMSAKDLDKQFMHDEFYFLLTKKKKLNFVYVEDAKAYYKLPKKIKDYVNQMVRFLRSPSSSEKNFGKKFIKQYAAITLKDKINSFIHVGMRNPILAFFYIVIQLYSKMIFSLSKKNNEAIWSPIASTK